MGKDGDPDAGWIVRLEPILTGLSLDWRELPDLIGVGSPGPLDKDGIPQQRYISVISDEAGKRLLDRLGIAVETPAEPPGEQLDEIWDFGETDAATIGRRRREQARLRAYLLGGRAHSGCDICGREFPAALLVAAHIVPRALSGDEHRKDFASIAMLACSLGCDDLFELGYIVVDEAGLVQAGRVADTPALASAVDQLANRVCTAHNERTAADFAGHARLILV
ncbi:HNH endonuclease [Leifsonia poae]|uniref:HNH endonuclease n=1 Tax=Leifsonia poae TaxID=110933 RepID=UPI003D67072C